MDSKNIIKDSDAPPKAEEGNEFHELYNEAKLSQPIKKLEDKWKLVPAFLRLRGLVKQHIDSFNHFLNIDIKEIVKANSQMLSESDPGFYLKFTDINVGMPKVEEDFEQHNLMPHECRIRDLTYAAPIYVDLEYTKGDRIFLKREVEIGRMPMMLGASNCWLQGLTHEQLARVKECPYDPRGYFIIKGVEKVLLIQEQMSKNRIIIEQDAKKNFCAQVTSSTYERKSRTTIVNRNDKFYLKHNTLIEDIPVVVAFKAMGMQCDQEVAQIIGTEPIYLDGLALSLQECSQLNILTQNQALDYIGSKIKLAKTFGSSSKTKTLADEARDLLKNVMLSHIPLAKHHMPYFAKCRYMGLMIRRVIEAMHDPSKLDDKDYYGNKRLELAGQLISLLFEDLFKRFQFNLQKQIDSSLGRTGSRRENFDAITCIRSDTITMGLEQAISSGNWSLKRFKMERQSVTQPLSRLSYISTIGMMTRINSQFEKTRKISGPRALQPSHWGILCPADTPEGESCGLVKNLALTTHVTTDTPEGPLHRICIDLGMEDASLLGGDELFSKKHFLIFLNGQPIGVHKQPLKFVRNFRFLRKRGRIQEFVSIYLNDQQNSIYIASDGGRLVRPLLTVEKGRVRLQQRDIEDLVLGLKDFNDFLREGLIEYLDVNEENNSLIALNEDQLTQGHTHMEIDPFTILGCVAGLIPYPHHNQSPRNTYQCAMGKQAIGSIGYNQLNRVDTLLYLMTYPQKPLVKTRTIEITNFEKLPAGQNASVAIMSYSGYDIEDAVILNRSSLDRGFGRALYIRRYQTDIKKYANGAADMIAPASIPKEKHKQAMFKKYHALDETGIARVGVSLASGDVYINKYSPSLTNDSGGTRQLKDEGGPKKSEPALDLSQLEFKSRAEAYKGANPAFVDRVILSSTPEDPFLIKVITRQTRVPEIGDKFSSRHGQKGVVGLIVPQEDMPFSERNGWCPDLIMNPHGFPSRMTVGKMIELISGKAGVLEGGCRYGTAFGGDNVEEMGRLLVKNGYSFDGKDALMSGITGEILPCFVFSGPIFYQRLKHMVQDKMHSRARGPKSTLTRQPTEGRSRDGGLRLGEMERDCLIGYGAANLLLERLMISSDQFVVWVCNKCGFIGYEGMCSYCKTGDSICSVKMPYACKLLLQELQSMNIRAQIKLTDV